MTTKTPVGVLVSGSGSNLQALIDAARAEDYPADIRLVISNRPGAFGLKRAEKAGIETRLIDHKTFANRETFEAALDKALRAAGVELVCLAGFMRVLTAGFVESWSGRILNIHPSLLPKYKGLNPQQQALDDGANESGCSVHIVTPELDDGPVLGQATVPVLQDDTAETLSERIIREEHRLYPGCLKYYLSSQMFANLPPARR